MTCYELVRVISRRLSRELPRVKPWKKLEAVTHSRVEATTCYGLAQIITRRLSHEFPRVIMSYEFYTRFIRYKSWKLADTRRNVVVNSRDVVATREKAP